MTDRAGHLLADDAPDPDAAPVPRASGMPYIRFLGRMHAHLKPDWYLEIGTETGKSLKHAPGKAIAVDPNFRLKHDVVAAREALLLYQGTSDAFFASGLAGRVAGRIDLAFLDGMHLIEFLVRDFIGTERICGPDSIIAIHDVVPVRYVGAERDWDRSRTVDWTGDVWKIVPILRRYRPDLTVTVADCAPSGLALVSGLDPESRVLEQNYELIVEEFRDLSISDYGAERLACDLSPVPAHAPELSSLAGPDAGATVPIPALRSSREARTAGRPYVIWMLYGPEAVDDASLDAAAHVFVASARIARRVGRRIGPGRASALLQGFDADLMSPGGDSVPSGALFVANGLKGRLRKTVRLALEQDVPLDLHGLRWETTEAARFLRSEYLPNEHLPAHYRGAGAVLNDHRGPMGRQGFVSNRIFDALACGAPVVTDPVDLPQDVRPWVHVYQTEESFGAVVAGALAEDADRRAERRAFAGELRETHSLDARVGAMMDLLS